MNIAIDEVPKDGKANEAISEFLANILGTQKANIHLKTGGKSKSKIFLIENKTPTECYESLASVIVNKE